MSIRRAKASAGARTLLVSYRCRRRFGFKAYLRTKSSILPEDLHRHATLVDEHEPSRSKTVRARHEAEPAGGERDTGTSTEILMGMRGHRHRFMPNRLVFPGGAVDRADLSAPFATGLSLRTQAALHRNANARLARGLGIAAARNCWRKPGSLWDRRRRSTGWIIWPAR